MSNICDREEIENQFRIRGIVFERTLMDIIADVYDLQLKDYQQYLWAEYGIAIPTEV